MSVFEDLSSKLKDALEGSSHASESTGGPPPAEGVVYSDLKYEEKIQKKERLSDKVCFPPPVLFSR